MTSDGKPPETSPEAFDDAFFSRASKPGLAEENADTAVDREAPTVPDPRGAPVASSADDELNDPSDLSPDFDEDAVLGRNRGLQIGGFFLVLVGAIGGGLAGYYALRSTVPKEAPATIASASASVNVAAPTISASAPVTVGSGAASAKAIKAPTSGARTSSKGGSSTEAGFAGSNSGGDGPSDPALAKGELSAGEISGVVERNRPLLKRGCWQPELEMRKAMGTATSARVNASFTIGPSGAVQSSSATGAENDYPGLASCIAARIKGWKFPPSASSTPVNVPFVFAAQ